MKYIFYFVLKFKILVPLKKVLNESPLNDLFKCSMKIKATRWDEAKYFANISVEIGNFNFEK